MDLTDKTQLIQYLKQNGLWAKKGLSQNFLVDKTALDKIVEAGELKDNDFVIEIGPGVGTLTRELVDHAGEVIAVEMDEKLAELLSQEYCHSREDGNLETGSRIKSGMTKSGVLKIINADILKLNLNEIIGDRKYKVIANIPYHITSKILELFLSRENKPELMVLLVQKEVAERVCAKPGAMSVLSVSVQLYGEPEIVGIVPKESFFPSPKVDSAILRIRNIAAVHPELDSGSRNEEIPDQVRDDNLIDEKQFFRCVKIGFASRRKTLLNNLSAGYQLDKNKVEDIIKSVGLNENVRAQELKIEQWRELCQKI